MDPILSLAFGVQAKPGVYALLLGSGISRAAGVPTGWEITRDLVRRLAGLEGAADKAGEDPEEWFR